MAKNYTISFMSLRSHTVYTVTIGGGSGAAVPLLGGAQPFSTQEDNNEDQFTPIRTQSGYIRIVDNGFAADGVTPFDWHDLIPATDTSRPVTLTHVENNTTIVDWQGFMQAQTFSGELYGNPQQREFPIQCILTSLSKFDIPTNETALRNFAYLLNLFINTSGITINQIVVQGGSDAQQWLLALIDWRNFMNVGKQNYSAKYKFYEILSDICQFWGWTCRTYRQTIYLTMADDQSEQSYLTLTMAQLETMAGGTAAGTVTSSIPSVTLSGDIFASIQNDEIQILGYSKATVKADANKETTIFEFAPQSVVDSMEANGYTWVTESGDYGYFTTEEINSFTSNSLIGGSSQYGAYARRQLFGEETNGEANIIDAMLFKTWADINVHSSSDVDNWTFGTPYITLETVFQTAFSSGALKLTGTPFNGSEQLVFSGEPRVFAACIGIGQSRSSAKWLHLNSTLEPEWISTKKMVFISLNFAPTLRICKPVASLGYIYFIWDLYDKIPVADNLYGYLYIDIFGTINYAGMKITDNGIWQLANLKVEYTRDKIEVTSHGAYKITKDRNDQKEYSAENQNASNNKWNADCIFASDNDMEYGYGLMLKGNGEYLKTAPFGGIQEIPEQHLANRVAYFGLSSKRQYNLELRTNEIPAITPIDKVSFNGTVCHPIAISREWRDDVTQITLLEMPEGYESSSELGNEEITESSI